MRKATLTILTLLLGVQIFAQEAEWDIEAGLCHSLFARAVTLDNNGRVIKHADIIAGETESSYTVNGRTVTYHNSPVIFPTVAVTAGYHIPELPLKVRLGLYINHAENQLQGGPSLLKERETIVDLMPELRCYYIERPVFRVFASLEAGLSTSFFSESLGDDTVRGAQCAFSWQLAPAGMEIGRRWYFSFAFGLGRVWDYGIINVGYRFGKSPR